MDILNRFTWIFSECPKSPDYCVDWEAIAAQFTWIETLQNCSQDPIYHAEGNVWTHTKLVCKAMIALPTWQALEPPKQSILFMAALLHDVAKPAATIVEADGRISSKGHVRQGVKMARQILWDLQVPLWEREAIARLIEFGSLPLWFWDKPDPQRAVIRASQLMRCDWLAMLAEADLRGRWCNDQQALLERVTFFREYCDELGCSDRPWHFHSAQSRFSYFQKTEANPYAEIFDDTRCEVILMSGLPGVGKDFWIQQHYPEYPIVSLDALRQELGIAPTQEQGEVVRRAKELARAHLREGRSFVWNGTNLSRQLRGGLIELFAAYQARVRIVYLEAPQELQRSRNRSRVAQVPEAVIERMRVRLEVPDVTEAQRVDWLFN
jgi:putative nucleotidyltransferase with HDIG domain